MTFLGLLLSNTLNFTYEIYFYFFEFVFDKFVVLYYKLF